MASMGWAERREYVRVPTELRAKLSNGDMCDMETSVLLRDVSAGGLGFVASNEQSETLEALNRVPGPIVVELPLESGHTLRASVELMWGSVDYGMSPPLFAGGLKFTDIEKRDKSALLAYIGVKAKSMASQRLRSARADT